MADVFDSDGTAEPARGSDSMTETVGPLPTGQSALQKAEAADNSLPHAVVPDSEGEELDVDSRPVGNVTAQDMLYETLHGGDGEDDENRTDQVGSAAVQTTPNVANGKANGKASRKFLTKAVTKPKAKAVPKAKVVRKANAAPTPKLAVAKAKVKAKVKVISDDEDGNYDDNLGDVDGSEDESDDYVVELRKKSKVAPAKTATVKRIARSKAAKPAPKQPTAEPAKAKGKEKEKAASSDDDDDVDSSDPDEDPSEIDEEAVEKPKKKMPAKKKAGAKAQAKEPAKSKKTKRKAAEFDDDDAEAGKEEEMPDKKKKALKPVKAIAKSTGKRKAIDSDNEMDKNDNSGELEEESSTEDEKPAKRKKTPTKPAVKAANEMLPAASTKKKTTTVKSAKSQYLKKAAPTKSALGKRMKDVADEEVDSAPSKKNAVIRKVASMTAKAKQIPVAKKTKKMAKEVMERTPGEYDENAEEAESDADCGAHEENGDDPEAGEYQDGSAAAGGTKGRAFLGSLSFSAGDVETASIVQAACKSLIGYSDALVSSASMFIVGDNSKRTESILLAISRSIPVVSVDFVTASISAGKWLNWRDYERHAGGKASRLRKEASNEGGFLKRMRVKVCGTPPIPLATLDAIVKYSGGLIVNSRADVTLVGTGSTKLSDADSNPVRFKWLADSVEGQRILGFEAYIVGDKAAASPLTPVGPVANEVAAPE
jgi:hypothetical protein